MRVALQEALDAFLRDEGKTAKIREAAIANLSKVYSSDKLESCVWADQFGLDYDVPARLEAALNSIGFSDESYHNNVCPSFAKELHNGDQLIVWCGHPDHEQREDPKAPRYLIQLSLTNENTVKDLICLDNFLDVVAYVCHYLNAPVPEVAHG